MTSKVRYFDSPAMRESLRRYIRIQMTSRNLKYRDLSERLEEIGIRQEERTLRNKVSKGNLGAQLFMYILVALDVQELKISEITDLLSSIQAD